MFGGDDDAAGGGEGLQREHGEQSHGAGAGDQDVVVGGHLGTQRRMDGAGQRFDQYGALVRQGVGYRVQLRSVGDQLL